MNNSLVKKEPNVSKDFALKYNNITGQYFYYYFNTQLYNLTSHKAQCKVNNIGDVYQLET
jgi:hypothetical protein